MYLMSTSLYCTPFHYLSLANNVFTIENCELYIYMFLMQRYLRISPVRNTYKHKHTYTQILIYTIPYTHVCGYTHQHTYTNTQTPTPPTPHTDVCEHCQ